MFPGTAPTSSANKGVQICVEPTDWRIKEITFNGEEKYLPHPTFSELVESNVKRINWRDVVGKEASLDLRPKEDESMDEFEQRFLHELTIVKPVAGPWADVAKSIHSAVQDMDVLLDTLCFLRTPYMDALPVSAIVDEQKTSEQISTSKVFQFGAHKKVSFGDCFLIESVSQMYTALTESAAVIAMGERSRDSSERSEFFNELRKMRQNWRIRKLNELAVGDLGYYVYGPKYRTSEVFDIVRNTVNDVKHGALSGLHGAAAVSCPIQVQVPLCLARRTTMCVIVHEDSERTILDTLKRRPVPVDDMSSRNVHWSKALKWAQNTLMLGDALMQLRADCVDSKLICSSTDECIVLKLFDTTMLRIELKFHPFEDGEIPKEGDPYLSRALVELYAEETSKPPYRNQQFISLRQSSLPDSLHLRGPIGMSAEEITARMPKPTTLLQRIINVSNHYLMVRVVVETLKKHILEYPDPQLQFKFIRSTNAHSLLNVSFTNQFYEQLGKFSLYIRIFADNVVVVTKECQQIYCRREMNLFQEALRLLTVNYQQQAIGMLAKHYGWQILHSNNNAFNVDGVPAPTLYVCNQTAGKQIFLQYATDASRPKIFIKTNEDPAKPLDVTGATPAERFRRVNYMHLYGSTLLRKMDNLLLNCRE